MIIYLIIFLIILVILSLIIIFYHPISLWIEKKTFKHRVYKKVYKIAKNYDFYLLNKVAINVDGKIIHFDHLLFGNKYIYCIGSNYYSFAINGKFDDATWFKYKKNKTFQLIKNPMKIHRERVNYFASLITSSKDLFVSCVIINDSCLLPEIDGCSNYDKIINLNKLENLVKEKESNKDISFIDQKLLHRLVLDIYKKGVSQ